MPTGTKVSKINGRCGDPWVVKYFSKRGLVIEVNDAGWSPNVGEYVLVKNIQRKVNRIVWDIHNRETFVYLEMD